MAKKYIPATIAGLQRKIYIQDLQKVHKTQKKIGIPIPAYSMVIIIRRAT